ncbi:MAG: twin-arginine translocase TatA/TatE family subunit [Deltaproteobacteria bacterium]|nr:twin-arginine translocase TatA/TatE family subunit [Deltaproteobacteria bacterium]
MFGTNAPIVLKAFSTPGIGELILILVIVLVIFGPGKIPALGDAIGRGIKNFRRSFRGQDDIDVTPKKPEIEAPSEKKSVAVEAPKIESKEKVDRPE